MDTVVLAPAGYLLDPDIGSDYERPWRLVEGLAKRGVRVVLVAREVKKLDLLGSNVELVRLPGHAPESPLGKVVDRVNLYLQALRVARREIASGRVLAVHHLGPCGQQSPSLIGPISVPFVYGPLPGARPPTVVDDEWLSWLLSTNATATQGWMSIVASKPARVLARALWRRTMRLADVVTVEARASAPPELPDAVVIPPGIDTVQFSPGRPVDQIDGRVIAVGRLIARKGYEALIRAMHEVVAAYRPAHLLIVGTGPEEQPLKRLTSSLGMDQCVTFVGTVARSELPELLNTAVAFCHPAVWDNVPFALLEGMACGLPPVVSSAGALPEMVGSAGLVFPIGQTDSLAAHLTTVLTEPGLRQSLAVAARTRILEAFTWQQMCDSYLDLYLRLSRSGMNGF